MSNVRVPDDDDNTGAVVAIVAGGLGIGLGVLTLAAFALDRATSPAGLSPDRAAKRAVAKTIVEAPPAWTSGRLRHEAGGAAPKVRPTLVDSPRAPLARKVLAQTVITPAVQSAMENVVARTPPGAPSKPTSSLAVKLAERTAQKGSQGVTRPASAQQEFCGKCGDAIQRGERAVYVADASGKSRAYHIGHEPPRVVARAPTPQTAHEAKVVVNPGRPKNALRKLPQPKVGSDADTWINTVPATKEMAFCQKRECSKPLVPGSLAVHHRNSDGSVDAYHFDHAPAALKKAV